jgi:acyl-coenzyme A thioesterase PaaI-like protein
MHIEWLLIRWYRVFVVHLPPSSALSAETAHGASIATLFDEIMAYPVWRSGIAAFTANLNIDLRRTIPLLSTMRFDSRVVAVDGRKLRIVANITNGTDSKIVHAECKGLWVQSKQMDNTQAPETATTKIASKL